MRRVWTTSPNPGVRALGAEQDACLRDAAEPDELGAKLGGHLGCLLVAVHNEERVPTLDRVGQPGAGGGVLGLLEAPQSSRRPRL